MHPLAKRANEKLPQRIVNLLSQKGRSIYFPTGGILGQAADAKGRMINGTIGIALDEAGDPLHLPGLDQWVQLPPQDAYPYAPSYGKPALRDIWQAMLRDKNPMLGDRLISRPVVTNALTHGLSTAGALFLDPGDHLILPDLFWGNYRLLFEYGCGAQLTTYPTFKGGGFNVEGLRARLAEGGPGKRVVILNFPNNPSGYTCTEAEAFAIRDVLVESANRGQDVVCLIDDAYFGLVFREGVFRESIFGVLAHAHPGLLAVKIDGATKEDCVWGYRVGFLTYGFQGADSDALGALEDKTAGHVRSTISNASHPAQSLLLKTYQSPQYPQWKADIYRVLKERFEVVESTLEAHPEYRESFEVLPFNSGYFLCVRPHSAEPEQIRLALLENHDTGLIATGDLLRIAYSSVSSHDLPILFQQLHEVVSSMA